MPILFIHHAAKRGDHSFPPNSLPAIQHCLAASARVVEVDISPLAGDDFLLAHDADLARFTTGQGMVAGLAPEAASGLRLTWRDAATPHPPALLSQALDLLGQHAGPVELQLDLKIHTPLIGPELGQLVVLLEPLGSKVRVTSGADWALRRLHALDPTLPLGFDPLLYLDDPDSAGRDAGVPPVQLGAYGYYDDHPLASRRWGSPAEYLRERAECLWSQMPFAGVWYLRAQLVLRALKDGFDWIDFLQRRGVEVAAWTLNPDRPADIAAAQRLAALGVDRITSDDPAGLAAMLVSETTTN